MIRSFLHLQASSGGINPENLLETSSDGGRSFPEAVTFWRAALDRVRQDPGVLFAAVTSRPPVHGARGQKFAIDGRPQPRSRRGGAGRRHPGQRGLLPHDGNSAAEGARIFREGLRGFDACRHHQPEPGAEALSRTRIRSGSVSASRSVRRCRVARRPGPWRTSGGRLSAWPPTSGRRTSTNNLPRRCTGRTRRSSSTTCS